MTALLGVCGPHEGIPVDTLRDLFAQVTRFTAKPSVLSQADYLDTCWKAAMLPIVTFDPDSFPLIDWPLVRLEPNAQEWQDQAAEQMAWYRGFWGTSPPWIVHVWNEWRGTGGFESSPLPAAAVNHLLRIAREQFGPDQNLAHGSIVDGQPASLEELDWTHANYATVDEYTKTAPGHEHEPPGGDVLDVAKYRAVLPAHVQIIVMEIGLSSWQAGEQAQANYCESIMSYAKALPDLAVCNWFCGHPYNGWGLVAEDGSAKLSYSAYQRATAAPGTPDPPTDGGTDPPTDPGDSGGSTEPGDDMAVPTQVYEIVWKAQLPAAAFNPGFGVEKFWMAHYRELGAVLDLAEHRVGKDAYRTFVGGIVHWNDDTGATIV